ncbi:MAG: hypothetical protein IPP72_14525 [Chitinophagaceae bacterium]|nr:hypothetical protein [Chitinophagaceae bacterium]
MASKYSISIVHPSFELLKNASRLLHFMAAAFFAINAVHQLSAHEGSKLVCYTQLIIAVDILVLVFFGAGILTEKPKAAVLFRLIESLTFIGIWLTLTNENHPWLGAVHAILGAVYFFICYREWRISVSEAIEIKPSGVTVPNFIANADIRWLHIKKVVADYNSIIIETVRDKKVEFRLRNNLKIEELEQINDFCRERAMLIV